MCPGVVRIQLEGELVFALGVVPLPLHLIQAPHQGMGSRKRWIQFQRPVDRANYFWLHCTRRSPANARHAQCVIGMRQAEVSRCKRRVPLDGLLKVRNAFLRCSWAVAFFDELPLEKVLINVRGDLARGYKPSAFCTGDRNLYSSSNSLCHLALQSESIPEFTVVVLGPEVFVGRGADELGVNADPTALAYDRAFHYGIDAESLGDFRQRRPGILEMHRRGARDDAKAANHGQASDDLLGHAVRKIFLGRIARKV